MRVTGPGPALVTVGAWCYLWMTSFGARAGDCPSLQASRTSFSRHRSVSFLMDVLRPDDVECLVLIVLIVSCRTLTIRPIRPSTRRPPLCSRGLAVLQQTLDNGGLGSWKHVEVSRKKAQRSRLLGSSSQARGRSHDVSFLSLCPGQVGCLTDKRSLQNLNASPGLPDPHA